MKRMIRRQEAFQKDQLNLHESLFFTANGYIGVRGTLEEGLPGGWNTMRGIYINGVYEVIPMKQAESLCNLVEKKQTMLNAVDTQTIFLSMEGEGFSLGGGTLLGNERVLDMSGGTAARHILWTSPEGRKAEITIRRMTSFIRTDLFLIDYQVKPLNFSGEIRFDSWHIADVKNYSNPDDPRLAAESEAYLQVESMEYCGAASLSLARTAVSGIAVAAAVSHRCTVDGVPVQPFGSYLTEGEEKSVSRGCISYKINAEEGQTVRLLKYTVLSDSVRCGNPLDMAASELDFIMEEDPAALYREQEEYLDRFWNQSEMSIEGDEELNQAVSFNMYALLQSASRDRFSSIAAKGLSGEGYEGHYFWDTEMYMAPFFTLTNPELAKTILAYRVSTLDAARENAALLGHKRGALYPWRTITGVECSGYFPSGTAAYHINGDIAYAVVQYYLTTGDRAFLVEEGGYELLVETARLWLDTGNYYKGKFVINEVTGPDEYTCMVNNNYYTNCCAKYNMHWAVKLAESFGGDADFRREMDRLGVTEEELARLRRAADAVFLPYDEDLGINPQDDSFLMKPVWDIGGTPKDHFPLLLHYHPLTLYRYQVCKQADTILAYFLFDGCEKREVMERSFRYYEKITTHDSSLSTCVFSLVASRLGLKEEAFRYFGDSAKLDLMNLHHNSGDGIHTANMGGCYMAIVNGFAGLSVTEKGLAVDPYVPGGWTGYRFKFRYRGSLLRLTVDRDGASMELLEGDGVHLLARGREVVLSAGESASF